MLWDILTEKCLESIICTLVQLGGGLKCVALFTRQFLSAIPLQDLLFYDPFLTLLSFINTLQACNEKSPYDGPFKRSAPSWCYASFEPEGILRSAYGSFIF